MNDNNGKQAIFTSMMPTPDKGQKQVPLLILRQESTRADFLAVLKPMKAKKEKAMEGQVQFHRESNGSIRVVVSLGKREDQVQLKKTEVLYKKNGTQPIKIKLEL